MILEQTLMENHPILMEGALAERLKREYGLLPDPQVAWAGLCASASGRQALTRLWLQYAAVAASCGLPYLATTPTRRADRERVAASQWNADILLENVRLLREVQRQSPADMLVGGMLGCRGDAYTGEGCLDEEPAHKYHAWQAGLFSQAPVDFLYAALQPTLPEATGMALALADTGIPYIISFTLQGNGRLIDGTRLCDAIDAIDSITSPMPVFYMTNCVHPAIVYDALSQPFNRCESVRLRFKGIQANTSALSYAELDGAADLKTSPPDDFAESMLRLHRDKKLLVFGGCCGTDEQYMDRVARGLCARP